MKKQYLQFPTWKQKNYLPKLGRHLRHAFMAAYKSDGGEGDDDDDDDVAIAEKKALLATIKKQVGKQLEGRAKKEDIDAITKQLSFLTHSKNDKGEDIASEFPIEALRSLADPKNGAMAKIVDQGVLIQQMKAEGEKQIKDMSVRAQIAAWSEKNKATLEAIKNGEKRDIPVMEIRAAASPMTVATVNSGASPYIGRFEVEPGITPFLVFPNTFWNFLTKGRTGSPTYIWVNKSNRQGAAGFIGPGVAKPGVSFELVAETSNAKKIAVSGKVGTELLQDIDGMTSYVEQELREQLDIEINNKLMTGTVSSTVPAGIQSLSQLYSFYTTAAAIKTTNPTVLDAVRAAIGALRSGKIQGVVTVFMNSVDITNMDIAKAVDSGVYLIPPFITANGTVIAGSRIIEDNNVPVGYIQAGFIQYYRVFIYKDYTVNWGWENDDFTKNLLTVVGEMRLHQFFNDVYTGAFLYDTLANITTAITQA